MDQVDLCPSAKAAGGARRHVGLGLIELEWNDSYRGERNPTAALALIRFGTNIQLKALRDALSAHSGTIEPTH
jgi:hypothetical protein